MDLTKREKIGLSIFGAILILGAVAMNFRGAEGISVIPKNTTVEQAELVSGQASAAKESKDYTEGALVQNETAQGETQIQTATLQPPRQIRVCILGQVRNPGVYTLAEGDRIEQAVLLAGGFTENAQTAQINLAKKLKDEDLIKIPDRNEKPVSDDQSTVATVVSSVIDSTVQQTGKVNINTASLEQLDTLPRVGKVIAQRIIEYRQSAGGFKAIEALMDVSGIGSKMYENLKDKITVQ